MIFTSSITGPRVTSPGHGHYSASQGRHQRLHPRRGARVRRLRHHRQRRRAGQHPDRRRCRCHRSPEFIRQMARPCPARPPRHARATSPTPSCSSPPTRRPTSPARRSSSTAARSFPKATISDCCRAEQRATWGAVTFNLAPSTWGEIGCLAAGRRLPDWHDPADQALVRRLPVPARGHQPRVWLYFRFPLSLRMVEEMLAARGILVSHETVRQWALQVRPGIRQPDPPAAASVPATSGTSTRS